MGGRGSGRYCRWSNTTTIEETKRVDIRYMRRKGLLRPGTGGLLTWSRNGEQSGSVNYRSYADRVELSYRYNGEPDLINVTVQICFTPCRFGGDRQWFHCPHCHSRCEVLCLAGKYPACRKCYRLPYQSQLEDGLGRLQRRQNKLEEMLWGDKRKWWRKPKRERLEAEWERIAMAADEAFVLAAANLLGDADLRRLIE
jgi:hypothetical protein